MQTIINVANATENQQQIYLLQLQIRDTTQKLAEPNLGNFMIISIYLSIYLPIYLHLQIRDTTQKLAEPNLGNYIFVFYFEIYLFVYFYITDLYMTISIYHSFSYIYL